MRESVRETTAGGAHEHRLCFYFANTMRAASMNVRKQLCATAASSRCKLELGGWPVCPESIGDAFVFVSPEYNHGTGGVEERSRLPLRRMESQMRSERAA